MPVNVELQSKDFITFTVKVSAMIINPYGPDIDVELATEAERDKVVEAVRRLTRLLRKAELQVQEMDRFIKDVERTLGEEYNVKAFIDLTDHLTHILKEMTKDENMPIRISVSAVV